MIFYRNQWATLWLQLTADEPLGVLDTGHLEDFEGTDGQVSLYHPASRQRWPVLMAATPDDSRANFRGWADLRPLPAGIYEIQGRCRDLLGNHTILGAVAAPRGDERVVRLAVALVLGARPQALLALPERAFLVSLGLRQALLVSAPRLTLLPVAPRQTLLEVHDAVALG